MAQPMRVPRPAEESFRPPSRKSTPVQDTSPRHVAPLLWGLLVLSLLFLGGVQLYVGRIERAILPASDAFAELPLIMSEGPASPVSRHALELRWAAVSGATTYHLRILTDRNSPVLDPVEVWTTSWTPSLEMLPGLVEGRYRWSVDALDSSGNVLARSGPGTFEVF
jgi:hypothetical protein